MYRPETRPWGIMDEPITIYFSLSTFFCEAVATNELNDASVSKSYRVYIPKPNYPELVYCQIVAR